MRYKTTQPGGRNTPKLYVHRVVWEAHNANSPRSTGLAIDFSPANRFTQFAQDYSLMSLGQATQWDEWLAVAP